MAVNLRTLKNNLRVEKITCFKQYPLHIHVIVFVYMTMQLCIGVFIAQSRGHQVPKGECNKEPMHMQLVIQ